MPLLIKIFLDKDAISDSDKRHKERESNLIRKDSMNDKEREREKEREKESLEDVVSATTASNTASNTSSSSNPIASVCAAVRSVNSGVIAHIFDTEMIQLIMQDVIGMTSHGITSSTSSSSSGGALLERTLSHDNEKPDSDNSKEKDEARERETPRETLRETPRGLEDGGGDELDRSGKGDDKDAINGQSDASNLKIELLKVNK